MTRQTSVILALYLLAYCYASFLDLSTTAIALRGPNVHEQNVFVTQGTSYESAKAWLVTLLGALVMLGCFYFGLRHAGRVDEYWLHHPVQSFRNIYLNPWSRVALRFSPLHMMSFAIAFVLFRLAAAGNNLMIPLYGIAPIGAAIQWVAAHSSPLAGFTLVIFLLFYAIAIAVSPIAAWIIAVVRSLFDSCVPAEKF